MTTATMPETINVAAIFGGHQGKQVLFDVVDLEDKDSMPYLLLDKDTVYKATLVLERVVVEEIDIDTIPDDATMSYDLAELCQTP